jgi:hypothetical protein
MSSRQQMFNIRLSGGHRSLTNEDIVDMLSEAYMVYFQEDCDYKEPTITAELINEVHI